MLHTYTCTVHGVLHARAGTAHGRVPVRVPRQQCALHTLGHVHSGGPGDDTGLCERALHVCVSRGGVAAVTKVVGTPGLCPHLCVQARMCTWLLEKKCLKMEPSAPS